jgi:hypothetical protein
MTAFATIDEAIEEIRQGRVIVVVDDEDRENEGDLVMAADKATPEAVNFMAKHGRGLICVPMLGERLDELEIGMMVSNNTAPMGTAFTVTVDARRGVTTGTSAYDRAVTIRTLVDPTMGTRDLTAPGQCTSEKLATIGGNSQKVTGAYLEGIGKFKPNIPVSCDKTPEEWGKQKCAEYFSAGNTDSSTRFNNVVCSSLSCVLLGGKSLTAIGCTAQGGKPLTQGYSDTNSVPVCCVGSSS